MRLQLFGFNFVCLQTFIAVDDKEFDSLTLINSTAAITFDIAIVNEDVISLIAGDKTEALLNIEPFDGAGLFIAAVAGRSPGWLAVLSCYGFALIAARRLRGGWL
jgi:hypothetical protein